MNIDTRGPGRVTFALLLPIVILAGCRADPNDRLGQETLSQMVDSESRQGITVKSFTKTNGIKREIAGQAIYVLEFSSLLRFERAGWKGGDAFVGKFNDFSLVGEEPSGFGAFGNNWNYYDAGDEVEVTGEITYEDTEKGWRPTGRSVKAYRITASKKDQLLARLVGEWDGHTIYYDAQERRNKTGAEQKLGFIRDDKGVKLVNADGMVRAEDDIYVKYRGGKLFGRFILGKHGGTHGFEYPKAFTLELRDDGTLLYEDRYEDSNEAHIKAELHKK